MGFAGRFLGGTCGLLFDPCGRPERPPRDANVALEVRGERALVREAGAGGDLRQGQVRSCLQQLLGPLDEWRRGEEVVNRAGAEFFCRAWRGNPRRVWIVCPRCPAAAAGNRQSGPSRASMLWPCAFESTLARFGPTTPMRFRGFALDPKVARSALVLPQLALM
jgi:hypothetical protein